MSHIKNKIEMCVISNIRLKRVLINADAYVRQERERERERAKKKEKERESVYECVRDTEREREFVCVIVCLSNCCSI